MVSPWQQHQLAPQEPETTGGRAPLEGKDERREISENSAARYTEKSFRNHCLTCGI